jgi:hypothetical protein
MIKKYITALTIALILILARTAPVMAYEPPSQETTDNATDVILWQGGEININNTQNGTIAVSTNGTVEISGLEDGIDNIKDDVDNFFSLAVVGLITALALWRKDSVFIRIIACPLLVVYGLRLADSDSTHSALWIEGVVIALIGTSFLYEPVIELIKKMRNKTGKME